MLFLVSTPIGNLSDITLRAIETLKTADKILCEDTRHSQILLHHYHINTPVISYHKFNETEKLPYIISELKEGKTYCLISDAGTPLISDPGLLLVKQCIAEQIPVSTLPGPCALIQALIASGLAWDKFQFVGFIPKTMTERRKTLHHLAVYPGVSIIYESPHRLKDTLEALSEINPHLNGCVARELTKKFETYRRGTLQDLSAQFADEPIKGECVLLVEGKEAPTDFGNLTLEEHVHEVENAFNISKKEAIKIVAELRGVPKKDLYRKIHID